MHVCMCVCICMYERMCVYINVYKEGLLEWLIGCDLGRQVVAISDKVSPHNKKAQCDGYSCLSVHIGCWIILNSARVYHTTLF